MPFELQQRKIVEQFAGPQTRLLVTGSDRAGRPTVEVAHEALIRTWPRLREWINANREKLRARAAVLQAKTDWEQNSKRDDMLLPSGLQLERARNLLADPGDITTDDLKEFISLSSARSDRSRWVEHWLFAASPQRSLQTAPTYVFTAAIEWPRQQIWLYLYKSGGPEPKGHWYIEFKVKITHFGVATKLRRPKYRLRFGISSKKGGDQSADERIYP
jgi:hypothetical protein